MRISSIYSGLPSARAVFGAMGMAMVSSANTMWKMFVSLIKYVFSTLEPSKGSTLVLNAAANSAPAFDPWSVCLFGFLEKDRVLQHCPLVGAQAWPICYQRLTSLFTVIDPTLVFATHVNFLYAPNWTVCFRVPFQSCERQSSLTVAKLGTSQKNTVGRPTWRHVATVEEPGGNGNASGASCAKCGSALCVARSKSKVGSMIYSLCHFQSKVIHQMFS